MVKTVKQRTINFVLSSADYGGGNRPSGLVDDGCRDQLMALAASDGETAYL